jgi:LPS export ABC transporter protein LptC
MRSGRDEHARVGATAVGRRRRVLLGAALLSAALLLSAGCDGEPRGDDPPVPAAAAVAAVPAAERVPDQVLFDTTVTDSREGVRRWTLTSDRLEKYLDQDEVELHAVHMDFFQADTLFSVLTAARGRASQRNGNLFVWGDVVVVASDGRRLETGELNYDDRSGRISNEVFNRFTREADVMTGVGMQATPGLDYFELKREVDATVHAVPEAAGDGEGP